MITRRRFARLAAASALTPGLPLSPAGAQAWPSRYVRLIVPFVAGGATDIIARAIGHRLSEVWGQQVVVENKPGAGTNIGAQLVAHSDPDGYTLYITSVPHATNRFLYASLGYASLSHPRWRTEGPRLGGVARSHDGGATWQKVEHDYTRATIVPPSRPDLLLAGRDAIRRLGGGRYVPIFGQINVVQPVGLNVVRAGRKISQRPGHGVIADSRLMKSIQVGFPSAAVLAPVMRLVD